LQELLKADEGLKGDHQRETGEECKLYFLSTPFRAEASLLSRVAPYGFESGDGVGAAVVGRE